MDWDKVTVELEKPLDRSRVADRKQAGRTLSYIEGWWAIAEANRIFGFNGWHRQTEEVRCVSERERKIGQQGEVGWGVTYVAKSVISIVDGTTRDGWGSGHGIDRDLGLAHESAIKEAETDAMKRALMTFGNPFGLALYDKTQANVSDRSFDTPPTLATGISPKDYESVRGDPSSAQSGKSYKMLEPAMKANKTPSELNDWWTNHQDEIKALNTNGRWEFFMQMIERGLSLCNKPLAVNLFWSTHLNALNALKKSDPNHINYDLLEEMMTTRVAWLTDPEAKEVAGR